MEKMTKREFLEAVANMNTAGMEDVSAYAQAELEKMAEAAEKRKGKRSEKDELKRAENERMARDIAVDILTSEAKTATDVAEILNANRAEEDQLKVQKVSYLCRLAHELGLANVMEVKIPKKGTQKGYTAAE